MTAAAQILPIPETPLRRKLLRLLAGLAFGAVLTWAWHGSEMRPLDLITYRGNMAAYLAGFLAVALNGVESPDWACSTA